MNSTKAIPAIDTHIHFWQLSNYHGFDNWFEGRDYLKRDYLPQHLLPELNDIGARGAIIVGAAPDSHSHNLDWGQMCKEHEHVLALVGSYSLTSKKLEQWLEEYKNERWFVGIRSQPLTHYSQWGNDTEADKGAKILARHNLAFDMLVDHSRIPGVRDFARKHASLPIILNHCGQPPFRNDDFSEWEKNIRELATVDNVMMKYSSFFLHSYPHCNLNKFKYAASVLFESFGPKRLLWGSNWPPELVGGSYKEAFEIMLSSTPKLSINEKEHLLYRNAIQVYQLKI